MVDPFVVVAKGANERLEYVAGGATKNHRIRGRFGLGEKALLNEAGNLMADNVFEEPWLSESEHKVQ